MNDMRQFLFMGGTGALVVSTLVVLATMVICYWSWQRSGFSRTHGFQELLRVLIVILVAVLFNQPEYVEEFRPKEKPSIAIIYDDTVSMNTQDAFALQLPEELTARIAAANEGEGESSNDTEEKPNPNTAIQRSEAIKPLIAPELWNSLAEQFDVVIKPISAEGGASETNLNSPLSDAAQQTRNLMGVVLISDGDWNAGSPPVEAATRLRMKEIPVFTVTTGSASRLPDVELTSLDVPTFSVAGKVVRIPFTIDSALPREYLTTVTLTTSEGETLTKDVRVAAMGRTTDAITWKPISQGDYTVSLKIPLHADETIPENNEKSAPIAIRQEQLKVLVVESYPRWEYRYLRNALSRDPGVDVSCLLFHPGLSKPGGGSKDYIEQFPDSIEELAKYDVVFLGDVGVEEGQLDEENCRLIKGLVEQQASGLVFMPGWQGRHISLLSTELGELCPVVLDDAQPGGWGSRTPGHFELTERGRASLLTKLADTREENVQVWEDLPGFQWYAAVTRAKAGSEVLAVHGEISNEFGRLPLLATRTSGAGKVLFMGTDGAWRWRKGVEDKYHYRFWGQVVRWMAYQRNMAKGETMRLFYAPDQPERGQTMTLHAHVMEAGGEPLSSGDVVARIVAPSGETDTVRLMPEGTEWGVFRGQFEPKEGGAHQVTLACKQTGAQLETKFFVQGEALEVAGKPARPEVMEEIARVTKGKSVEPNEIGDVIESLAKLPMPPASIRRLQLWSHPLAVVLLVILLGAFWIWRKAAGLV
ncbi:MAG: hypothetical protein H6824_24125 [Planctomycetaceae bacterium]|nr:hypothetical protein [Planctomycetaceae bacterium]